MYKVFLNDRKITIVEKGNITLNKTHKTVENLNTKSDVRKWFLHFIEEDLREVFLIHKNENEFWENVFMAAFKSITAAGGVVIRNNEILFILRHNIWDLPKGKIDRNETAESAAIREVREECGITGHQIVRKLPSTFHLYQSPYKDSLNKWILKETHWFEMKYSGDEKGVPQTEENITEIRWIKRNKLNEVLTRTYENLKSVILLYRD